MSQDPIADLLMVNDALAELTTADAAHPSDAIALLYQAIANLPDQILQDFESFTEEILAAERDAHVARAMSGTIAIMAHREPRDTLLDASRLLRALEMDFIEPAGFIESNRDSDLEDAWRTGDGRHYVIPNLTVRQGINGKPFLRRALLRCRVIPAEIDYFAVRLHRLQPIVDATDVAAERGGRARSFGAAFFPGLTASTSEPAKGEFLVDKVTGFDARACLEDHVLCGQIGRCTAIIWAELTMPDDSLAVLREIAKRQAFNMHPAFSFLVAGSWHRAIDDKMRNVAVVLDAHGNSICEVFKWAKFPFRGKREAIVPGGEVHVLIGEEELYVIAICRDFLQATKEVPYRNMNVDVAIVPSMTSHLDDLRTMAGHAATADAMRVRFGTRTMVVAQPVTPVPAGVGRVLPFPAEPLQALAGELVTGAWFPCTL